MNISDNSYKILIIEIMALNNTNMLKFLHYELMYYQTYQKEISLYECSCIANLVCSFFLACFPTFCITLIFLINALFF